MDMLTRCACLEVAGRGVRVNAVNPGVIVTEAHKRSGMKDDDYEKVRTTKIIYTWEIMLHYLWINF